MNNKDYYYMGIAKEVSNASKCLSRKIGAVLVKYDTIISTGYNGPPRNIAHCENHAIVTDPDGNQHLKMNVVKSVVNNNAMTCPRKRAGFVSGEGMQFCIAGHGEENAIVQAARVGVSTKDSKLYCYCGIPCEKCCIKIINAGVTDVYCLKDNKNSKYDKNLSQELLENAKIKLHFMDFE